MLHAKTVYKSIRRLHGLVVSRDRSLIRIEVTHVPNTMHTSPVMIHPSSMPATGHPISPPPGPSSKIILPHTTLILPTHPAPHQPLSSMTQPPPKPHTSCHKQQLQTPCQNKNTPQTPSKPVQTKPIAICSRILQKPQPSDRNHPTFPSNTQNVIPAKAGIQSFLGRRTHKQHRDSLILYFFNSLLL